jgi:hypothetical protein
MERWEGRGGEVRKEEEEGERWKMEDAADQVT